MGSRGPLPKRSDQRRRRNQPDDVSGIRHADASVDVEAPPALKSWHPAARRWFESLAESGQSAFYEPSDWATAYVLAETMSRELRPRVVGVTKDGDVIKASVPISGASLSAILKGCSTLGVTEGDRLRLRIELTPPQEGDGNDGGDGTVSWIGEARRPS